MHCSQIWWFLVQITYVCFTIHRASTYTTLFPIFFLLSFRLVCAFVYSIQMNDFATILNECMTNGLEMGYFSHLIQILLELQSNYGNVKNIFQHISYIFSYKMERLSIHQKFRYTLTENGVPNQPKNAVTNDLTSLFGLKIKYTK